MDIAADKQPVTAEERCDKYQQVAAAITYIAEHWREQPGLAEVAAAVGLSEYHFQRLFSQWAGVSPKQYLQFLTKEYALARLQNSSVQAAALDAGLSGTGRLHDLLIKCVGMTPGEYRRDAANIEIRYGSAPSPFGSCFIAWTERGLCELQFFDSEIEYRALLAAHQQDWAAAGHIADQAAAQQRVDSVFAGFIGDRSDSPQPLNLLMRGSPFQLQVWEALLAIAPGDVVSYQQVAASLGRPSASRARCGQARERTIHERAGTAWIAATPLFLAALHGHRLRRSS